MGAALLPTRGRDANEIQDLAHLREKENSNPDQPSRVEAKGTHTRSRPKDFCQRAGQPLPRADRRLPSADRTLPSAKVMVCDCAHMAAGGGPTDPSAPCHRSYGLHFWLVWKGAIRRLVLSGEGKGVGLERRRGDKTQVADSLLEAWQTRASARGWQCRVMSASDTEQDRARGSLRALGRISRDHHLQQRQQQQQRRRRDAHQIRKTINQVNLQLDHRLIWAIPPPTVHWMSALVGQLQTENLSHGSKDHGLRQLSDTKQGRERKGRLGVKRCRVT